MDGAVGCGEAVHGVGFTQQMAAVGLQSLVGQLVANDLDSGCEGGDQQNGSATRDIASVKWSLEDKPIANSEHLCRILG